MTARRSPNRYHRFGVSFVHTLTIRRRVAALALLPLFSVLAAMFVPLSVAHADSFVAISGSGSTWSSNALDQWRRDVEQYGIQRLAACYRNGFLASLCLEDGEVHCAQSRTKRPPDRRLVISDQNAN